jgi:hypothetical protein
MTQAEHIQNYLDSGKTLTAHQALRKFGVANLRARIDDLRKSGVPVYNNGGEYRLGKPSRLMVAAAYRLLGGRAFNR